MNKSHHNPFRNSVPCVNNSKNARNNFDKDLGRSIKSPNGFRPKKNPKKFNPDELNDKEKEWGKVKFNPITATTAGGKATPWLEFKREMLKNDEQKCRAGQNADSCGKSGLQSRELLYKNKIAEIQNLPTPQWEEFGETTSSKKSVKHKRSKAIGNMSHQRQSALIDDDCLRNFDSKKLNAAQNNKLRKIITGATITLSEQGSLTKTLKGFKNRNKRHNKT